MNKTSIDSILPSQDDPQPKVSIALIAAFAVAAAMFFVALIVSVHITPATGHVIQHSYPQPTTQSHEGLVQVDGCPAPQEYCGTWIDPDSQEYQEAMTWQISPPSTVAPAVTIPGLEQAQSGRTPTP
jgi:hypothetical protein